MMWNKKETQHYIFNYHKNSLAEKNIDEIIALQERCYDYICKFLKVKMNRRIQYFLCETPEEVGKMYGDNEPGNGATKKPDKIYAVYNEKLKCIGTHEDAHIISYNTLGDPKQALLREGLAMFFDKAWWRIPNEAWVQVFISRGLYVNLSRLADNQEFYRYSEIITYPIAGSFVNYLISIFGIERFKGFYKTIDDNFDKCFLETFGKSLNHIEEEFITYIQDIKYHESIHETIRLYLKRDGLLK